MGHLVPIFFKPNLSAEDIASAESELCKDFRTCDKFCGMIVLTEPVLRQLYSNIADDQPLWNATKRHFLGKLVRVVTFSVGESKFEEFVRFIGHHFDPERCDEDSLRRKLGKGSEAIPGSKKRLYFSAIHRPRTLKEAKAHFNALFARELVDA